MPWIGLSYLKGIAIGGGVLAVAAVLVVTVLLPNTPVEPGGPTPAQIQRCEAATTKTFDAAEDLIGKAFLSGGFFSMSDADQDKSESMFGKILDELKAACGADDLVSVDRYLPHFNPELQDRVAKLMGFDDYEHLQNVKALLDRCRSVNGYEEYRAFVKDHNEFVDEYGPYSHFNHDYTTALKQCVDELP